MTARSDRYRRPALAPVRPTGRQQLRNCERSGRAIDRGDRTAIEREVSAGDDAITCRWPMHYRVGAVEIDTDRFLLRVDGEDTRVEPQVFDVLSYLVEHRDRLVLKTELLDEIRGDRR